MTAITDAAATGAGRARTGGAVQILRPSCKGPAAHDGHFCLFFHPVAHLIERVLPTMAKPLIPASSPQPAGAAPARSVIVFGRCDSIVLPAAAPLQQSQAKTAFFDAFKADLGHPSAFAAPLALVDFPQWGRLVRGASGGILFHPSFRGGFVVRVALEGLVPDHPYILTLNGNPERAGNASLVDPVPGNEREKYFDFQTVTTDARGTYQATFGIALPAGPYDVRFYVKDPADFKIVLYHDFFRFGVK